MARAHAICRQAEEVTSSKLLGFSLRRVGFIVGTALPWAPFGLEGLASGQAARAALVNHVVGIRDQKIRCTTNTLDVS